MRGALALEPRAFLGFPGTAPIQGRAVVAACSAAAGSPDTLARSEASTVGGDNALNVIYGTFDDYRAHLRKGTAKTVFVVSDGNAIAPPYGSADAFVSGFSALDPQLLAGWKFAALYAFEACPSAREVGSVFNAVSIERPLFEGNLCALPANEHLITLADELVSVMCYSAVTRASEARSERSTVGRFVRYAREGSLEVRKREVAAFLGNISHETTGGWATAPGGPQAWGLCFREEVGCANGACTQYCDASNTR